jgi:hypothetical protein
MAPEQVEKPQSVDHRADIYSLGVVFYEMLTGELPLGKFPPPSQKVQVDVRLDEVVLHALEKEPARRYQQASQVKSAVETIAGTPSRSAPAGPAPAFSAPPAVASAGAIITAPAVALMVAGGLKLLAALCNSFNALLLIPIGSSWLLHLMGVGGWLSGMGSLALFGVWFFQLLPGLLLIFGGYQMWRRRSYGWAIAAGVIAILACGFISFGVGIWALIVLARNDVKAAFEVGGACPAAAGRSDTFWRHFAVAVACAIMIPAAVLIIGLVVAAMAIPSAVKAWDQAGAMTDQALQQADIQREGGEFRKTIRRSFPLDARGKFSISNINGQTQIHGWNSNVVALCAVIHGPTGPSVNDVKLYVDAGPTNASVRLEDSTDTSGNSGFLAWLLRHSHEDVKVDYSVQVPAELRQADVDCVNGRITIDGLAGDIRASTVNGETQIQNAVGNLNASTVDGTVMASLDSLSGGQRVSLDAINGKLQLSVPEDAHADFTADTVHGDITSEFVSLQPEKDSPAGHQLNGSLGHGGAKVTASAINGKIEIRQHPAVHAAVGATVPSTP